MRIGSPHIGGVAAARTYNHRGVIIAMPKETSLGLTRWTRIVAPDKEEKSRLYRSCLDAPMVRFSATCRFSLVSMA